MKDFLKMTFAVLLAIVLVTVLNLIIFSGISGSLTTSSSRLSKVPSSAVLKIDLSKVMIAEQSRELDIMSQVKKQDICILGLYDAVQAIRIAADDPSIKYIYIRADQNITPLANLSEIRTALSKFRSSGKPVIAYMENPGNASMYVSSVADKVLLEPYTGGMSSFNGLSSSLMYYKDLLDLVGVNVQLIRHGKYKSAGEPFIKNAPSKENLEQQEALITSLWSSIASVIADGRGTSVEKLNELIDGLELCLPEDYLKAGLVDELVSREELKTRLATFSAEESFDKVQMVSLADYAAIRVVPNYRAGKQIAVIYADGEIIEGDDMENVAGDRFANQISKVRADSTVKAVVLRVNSPGGSVTASEKIKAELDLLKKSKPLVASYGSYAASGGYWISANCDKIFSDDVTLTGSIGVFGMIPDFSKAVKNRLKVNVVNVSSNKHGDMFSLMRPLDKEENAFVQRSIEDIYTRFVNIVSSSRSMSVNEVDAIGQGRVWSGNDALSKGLVDEIGTLEDAVRYAAALAGEKDIDKWNVCGYPKPLSTLEMLMEQFGSNKEEDKILGSLEGTAFAPAASVVKNWYNGLKSKEQNFIFARVPFILDVR